MQLDALAPKTPANQWRIQLDYFYIFAFFGAFVGTFFEDLVQLTQRETLLWILAKGPSYAATYALWSCIRIWMKSIDKPDMSVWSILAIGALGGAIEPMALRSFLWLFDLQDPVPVASRIAGSALIGAIWLPAQSITVLNLRRFKKIHTLVQEEMIEIGLINLARQRLKIAEGKILEKRIVKIVSNSGKAVNSVFEKAIGDQQFKSLPNITRNLATDHIRVLAHNISELEIPNRRKMIFGDFRNEGLIELSNAIKNSILAHPLSPNLFTLVVVTTVALPQFRRSDWPVGFYILVVSGVSTYLIQHFALFVFNRTMKFPYLRLFLSTILNCFIPIFLFYFIPNNVPALRNQIGFVLSILFISAIGFTAQTGLILQENLIASEIAALEKMKLESSEINFELARVTKKWAQHIHGNMQSRLQAGALMLEITQNRQDSEGIRDAIEDIRIVISEMGKDLQKEDLLSFEEEIAAKIDLWEGIVETETSIARSLVHLKHDSAVEMAECVGEAISNAVRHGSAQRIILSIQQVEEGIEITVTDDGNGIGLDNSRRGYGSAVFDSATERPWTLVRDSINNQTVLKLQFIDFS